MGRKRPERMPVAGLALDGLDCVDCPAVDAGAVLRGLVDLVTACTGLGCQADGRIDAGTRGSQSADQGSPGAVGSGTPSLAPDATAIG